LALKREQDRSRTNEKRQGCMSSQVDTKTRILEAAEILFAEKGFSGTGIDEIAKRAEITKSVIYYHFKNKEDILQQMFRRFTDFALENKAQMGGRFFRGETDISTLLDNVMELFDIETVQRLSKILLMEAIKGNDRGLLFELWESNIDVLYENFGHLLNPVMREDRDRMQFETFFFGMMPALTFAVFRMQWEERYGKSRREIKQEFADTLAYFFEHAVKPRVWDVEAIEREREAQWEEDGG
jgi:AcrR family transcriptional regulator